MESGDLTGTRWRHVKDLPGGLVSGEGAQYVPIPGDVRYARLRARLPICLAAASVRFFEIATIPGYKRSCTCLRRPGIPPPVSVSIQIDRAAVST